MRSLLGQACPAARDGGTSELQVRPRGPGVLTDPYLGKSTSSGFTFSAWVQVTPCGPPSTTTKRLPLQLLCTASRGRDRNNPVGQEDAEELGLERIALNPYSTLLGSRHYYFEPRFSSWLVATWVGSGGSQSQIVVSSGR